MLDHPIRFNVLFAKRWERGENSKRKAHGRVEPKASRPIFRYLRYVILGFFALIMVDQIARWYVERSVFRDTDLLNEVLGEIRYNVENETKDLALCMHKDLTLGYRTHFCMGSRIQIIRTKDGTKIEYRKLGMSVIRSHFTSFFPQWWYYDFISHSGSQLVGVDDNYNIIVNLWEIKK